MRRFIIILILTSIVGVAHGEPSVTQESLLQGPVAEKLRDNGGLPVPVGQWTPAAKLWLARSCVGEAGFTAYDECIGIAWVYATRVKDTGIPFLSLIKRYSSALKYRSTKRRTWIVNLRLDGKIPENWPKKLSWKKHKVFWLRLLSVLDDWAKGYYANPVEGANHYGGPMDVPGKSWVRVQPESAWLFRNSFYKSVD